MRLAKATYSLFQSRVADGLLVRCRQAFPNPVAMVRAFRGPVSRPAALALAERIVVIGLGPAAFACVTALKQEGFQNVTVLASDSGYGGKCVNYGCMPAEYVLSRAPFDPDRPEDSVTGFIEDLRAGMKEKFEETGYRLVMATVTSIAGSSIHLADGGSLEFDRLICAMGNDYPLPSRLPDPFPKRIPVSDFWTLPRGSRVVIYAENNPTAVSLGEIGLRLGLVPTVLLAGVNPFAGLPSYRYFIRGMKAREVAVHESSRLLRIDPEVVTCEAAGKRMQIPYDHFLVLSKPVPRFPLIDGRRPDLQQVDLTCGSLATRPDISFLGDGSGFFTAADAENQARLLARFWRTGERLDLTACEKVPMCFHGSQSLALVGPPWVLAARGWNELDFRVLGWSKVHGLEGKLWFLCDEQGQRVEAIHICHPHAPELISIAALLLEKPVSDPAWMTLAVHPSAAEIFKRVAEQVQRLAGPMASSRIINNIKSVHKFEMPTTTDLHPVGGLPAWLTLDRYNRAMVSPQPREMLMAYFGLWQLATLGGCAPDCELEIGADRQWRIMGPDGLGIVVEPSPDLTRVVTNRYEVLIV